MNLLKALMTSNYVLAVVGSNRDVVLMCAGYCARCADSKLGGILKTYEVSNAECAIMNKPTDGSVPWRVLKVSCDCAGKLNAANTNNGSTVSTDAKDHLSSPSP